MFLLTILYSTTQHKGSKEFTKSTKINGKIYSYNKTIKGSF